MFFRRRSLFEFSSNRLSKAPRRQKRRGRRGSLRSHKHSRLGVEHLENRELLAVDVFLDAGSGAVTIEDASELAGGSQIQQDNFVTLSLGNFDPDGGDGAAMQDGLLITDTDGVNALSPGLLQVDATTVFVPQDFDFDPGIGVNLQAVLSPGIFVDLQDGNDRLRFEDNVADVPVVTDYLLDGGTSDDGEDRVLLSASDGIAEMVQIRGALSGAIETQIDGYAGVRILTEGNELISYVGAGDDDDLIVDLGRGDATAHVQRANSNSAGQVTSDVLPKVQFAGLQTFELESGEGQTTASFALANLLGATNYVFESAPGSISSELVAVGTTAADDITASLVAGELNLSHSLGQLATTGMGANDLLTVTSLGGDDILTVDVDGTDLIDTPIFYDGGVGSDLLEVLGNPTESITFVTYSPGLQVDEGRIDYDVNPVEAGLDMVINFDNLEPVVDLVVALNLEVNANAGDNQITYSAGPNSGLVAAPFNGNPTGEVSIDGFEILEFANKTNLDIEALDGDDTVVANNFELPLGLESITIRGGNGADHILLEALPDETTTTFTGAAALGDNGDDVIDGSGVSVPTSLNLIGGSGNDTLLGGAGEDGLVGGDGDDTLVDSQSADIYDGGSGLDTIAILATIADDTVDVFQNAPAAGLGDPYTLNVTVNGQFAIDSIVSNNLGLAPSDAANLPSVERILIEGREGDDATQVGHAHFYGDNNNANGVATQSIRFEVTGDAPNASDLLVVRDDVSGDTVIQRVGADQRSGSVTVGALAPVDYSGIEHTHVLPISEFTAGTGNDGLGRLVVFKDDPFEANNTLPNATFLGAGPTINVDPTIDPAGGPFGIPGDRDYFQFVAQETGTLDFQLYFEPIGTLANGQPGLPGNGELNATVFDNDGVAVAIGSSSAQDILDGSGNKIGERITVPVIRNESYFVRVQADAPEGVNVYNFTAVTTAAPIPELVDLQAASDSGRNNTDNITKIANATFNIILDDDRIDEFMNLDLNPDTVNDDAQSLNDAGLNRIDYGVEVFNNAVSIGFAFYTGVGNTWQFTASAGDLNEGDFNHISAAVWIRDAANPAQIGRHELSQALQVDLDTISPAGFFGLPGLTTDGLAASSDTGVLTTPATFDDRITSDTTPTLWGQAEANAVIHLYYDQDNDGVIDLNGADADIFLGQTVANPLDGNLAFPEGFWEITSELDLNEIINTRDGVRRLLMYAEDVAGNPMAMDIGAADPTGADAGTEINDANSLDELSIFIDTQGPQIYDPAGAMQAVHPTGFPTYDLFDPKPSVNGFTPLTNSITINVQDLPNRLDQAGVINDFLYNALEPNVAATVGNYSVVGDHVGQVPITGVAVNNAAPVNGQPATATIVLSFADNLPDDRFTLVVSENLVDPAGNNLDGESNANGPLDDPTFPSGDGVPGGDFVARFTIDSRPEIGSYVSQNIDIDINGNFVWDPANAQIGNDATNVDLTFTLGVANANGTVGQGRFGTHDLAFAGKFTNGNAPASGLLFDQLAAYGWSSELNARRWIVDTDSDGVVTLGTDILTFQPDIAGFNVAGAIPVAGNFDGNLANGDESRFVLCRPMGIRFESRFRDFRQVKSVVNNSLCSVTRSSVTLTAMDSDDAGVFNNNVLTFDLANDGFNGADQQLVWGFPGVLDRPVATDMDQDGIDDIGLWVPRNGAQDNRPIAEWYFLISDDPTGAQRVTGTINTLDHPFEPVPFGNDLVRGIRR